LEPPTRTTVQTHQCVCVMTHPNGTVKDSCHAIVSNPDQPFCAYCEAVGHPDLPEQGARIG
jgi:hypothetical protein